jgi:hypothetical protein
MDESNSILTTVARWLALKRREGATVDASILHDYLLTIDAPNGTVERCETMGWITYEPRKGYSACKSDFVGNIYPSPIRWIEARYAIGSAIEAVLKSATPVQSVASGTQIEGEATGGHSHSDLPQAGPDGQRHNIQPEPFRGGVMDFLENRVELCGVDICSGSRCSNRRQILELLRRRDRSGTFISYGGDQLAEELDPKAASGTVSGAIRDLRDDIVKRLRDHNIVCGNKDVILSGGPGYRFAECITVQLAGQPIAKPDEVLNVPKDVLKVVPNVSDNPARSRREWILRRLSDGGQLQGAAVAREFKCSLKTAKRDLGQLKADGKIEFIGPPRTGFYQLSKHEE